MSRREFGRNLKLRDEIVDSLIDYCPEDKLDKVADALVDIVAQHVEFTMTNHVDSIVESVTD